MKKFFSLFAAVLFAGSMMATATTITMAEQTINDTDNGFTLSAAGYEFTALKNEGSTKPTQNANSKDIRLYAKNTLQVACTGEMTQMVFTVSTAGKKRLTEVTASVGAVAIDADAWTVTWTGKADDVTFTVGEKATYGTDGEAKAGQFCFDAVEITGEVESPAEPEFVITVDVKAETIDIAPADANTVYAPLFGSIEQLNADNIQKEADMYGEYIESADNLLEYVEYGVFFQGPVQISFGMLGIDTETAGEYCVGVASMSWDEAAGACVVGTAVYTTFAIEEKVEPVDPVVPEGWAGVYTTNVEFVAGTNSYLTDKINIGDEQYPAFKIGKSSAGGDCEVVLPAGTTEFHFHAVCWSKTADTDLTVSGAYEETVVIKANNITGSSPYTFDLTISTPDQHYYKHVFDAPLAEETKVKFSCGYRAVFFGVNAANATTTALQNTTDIRTVKVMENGQIYIQRNGVRYDLSGKVVK